MKNLSLEIEKTINNVIVTIEGNSFNNFGSLTQYLVKEHLVGVEFKWKSDEDNDYQFVLKPTGTDNNVYDLNYDTYSKFIDWECSKNEERFVKALQEDIESVFHWYSLLPEYTTQLIIELPKEV